MSEPEWLPHTSICENIFDHSFQNHIPSQLCSSAHAAITKEHRLGGLNCRNVFSHSSGVQKSKIKTPRQIWFLVCADAFPAHGWPRVTVASPLHTCRERSTISPYKDISPIRSGTSPMTSFQYNYLPSSECSHTGGKALPCEFWGETI